MKVKYVKEVVTPVDKAGKVGEVKEMKKETAEWLIANGYAKPAKQAADSKGDSDKPSENAAE